MPPQVAGRGAKVGCIHIQVLMSGTWDAPPCLLLTCERVDSNGRISNSSNHHGLWKADGMLPVTWEEACRADGAWARAAHSLATRLGYEYKGEAAFPECPPTVREVVPLQG